MPSPNHSKEQLQNYLVAICELADLVANQYQSSEIQELLCESYASQNISSKMVKQEFLRDFEKMMNSIIRFSKRIDSFSDDQAIRLTQNEYSALKQFTDKFHSAFPELCACISKLIYNKQYKPNDYQLYLRMTQAKPSKEIVAITAQSWQKTFGSKKKEFFCVEEELKGISIDSTL